MELFNENDKRRQGQDWIRMVCIGYVLDILDYYGFPEMIKYVKHKTIFNIYFILIEIQYPRM